MMLGTRQTNDNAVQIHVNMVLPIFPGSEMKYRQIAEGTAGDSELQDVTFSMEDGWPAASCPNFFHIRGELSVETCNC